MKMLGSSCGSVCLIIINNIKYRKGCAGWALTYLLHECCAGSDEQLELLLWMVGVLIPVGARDFSLPQNVQAGSGAVLACIQRAPGLFPGGKAVGAWS
jgi:hypothetical protein